MLLEDDSDGLLLVEIEDLDDTERLLAGRNEEEDEDPEFWELALLEEALLLLTVVIPEVAEALTAVIGSSKL